jgi:hypothetical protein
MGLISLRTPSPRLGPLRRFPFDDDDLLETV